ncbi:hypothetical protein IB238_05010 [Rhizobium sp. ARZ01]|uniref:hypothetical protein n=1 Tax=Rhizobium sp. ARZ01 TaxID=2769313 RepID=UPI00177F929A|nr:hypothetical protein [Rhizobium sp. ARZ01]MBD9371996.1 hypothetical protein [Rhizobium sp. ARZ01]
MPTDKQPEKKQPTQKSLDDEKAKRKAEDEYLDEALEESFPASDPIAPPKFDDSKN